MLGVLPLASCTVHTDGIPIPNNQKIAQPSAHPRQTDGNGNTLPFVTEFYSRWNKGNDGTEYEPCTSLTNDALTALGLDPTSAEDAAAVDGQTARGCSWSATPPLGGDFWISQTVGNSPSLQSYKDKYRNLAKWRPDVLIGGRNVGVEEDVTGACTSYVQSGQAGVTTGSNSAGLNKLSLDDQCARVIAFTEATISKMPK